MGYEEILTAIKAEFGITLQLVNTGGGCYVFQSQLESGHWLVVTNAEDNVWHDADERARYEADEDYGNPLGWCVMLYGDHQRADWEYAGVVGPCDGCGSWCGNEDHVPTHTEEDAVLADLLSVLRRALPRLVNNYGRNPNDPGLV